MAPICATGVINAVFVLVFLQCDANENGFVNLVSDLRWQHLLNNPVVNFQTEELNPLGNIPYRIDTIPQMPTVVSNLGNFNSLAAKLRMPHVPKPNFVSPYAVDDRSTPYLIRFNTNESTGNEGKWSISQKSRDTFLANVALWYPLRSGLLSQLLYAKAFKNTKENKKLPSNRIRGWWLLKEKPTTGLLPNFAHLQKSRSTPKYLKNILQSMKSLRNDKLGRFKFNRMYSDAYPNSGWLRRITENNFQTILPSDQFDVFNRNFLWWLGTPKGKPLVLVRSLRPGSNMYGNGMWGVEESELSNNNFLLPRKPSNLFPYSTIDPYYNSLENSLFSTSDNIRKWPSHRIHVTWFAKQRARDILNRLAATQRKAPRKVISNAFLEQLLKQGKRKNVAGRLHATWLRDSLHPSFQEESYGLNNLSDHITRYPRSLNNKKKRISNRLKSIWLATLKPPSTAYLVQGRRTVTQE